MACTLRRFFSFDRHLKTVLKKFPNSAQEIEIILTEITNNPEQGVVYPGFAPFKVRKIRIGLKSYRISARDGLRLLYLHIPDRSIVAPLVIYKKGVIGSEQKTKALVLTALKDILEEM
jgi:hypothetical protein